MECDKSHLVIGIPMVTITDAPPGDELLLAARAGFVRRGLTLSHWCRVNGVQHSYAHRALRGLTNGPAAKALRTRIVEALDEAA